jgi:PAS domain S-box-containing protein
MTRPEHTKSFSQGAPSGHDDAGACMPIMPDEPLHFERLISDLSARFVNVSPDKVDGEIERALEHVREFFQVDRCALIGISPDQKKRLYVTHAAYGEGIEQVSGDIDLASLFPWLYDRVVLKGQPLRIGRMEELPESAGQDRSSCIAMGVQSFMNIPISFEGRVSSLIVINAMRGERSWPEECVPRLRLLGEIFINALERKRSEEALRESEDRLQIATNFAGAGLWSMDLDSGDVWGTAIMRELFNFAPGVELTYEGLLGRIHPEDRGRVDEAVQMSVRTATGLRVEFRLKLPDGGVRWIDARGHLYLSPTGIPERLMGLSIDITERRQMQDRLRNATGEWYQTFNTIRDMIMIMDREFRIVQANDAVMRFFGLPREEIIGAQCFRLMHKTEEPIDVCPFKKMMATKSHEETEVHEELRGKWFHIAVDPLLGDKGDIIGTVHTVKDITANKIMEAARRESMERYRAMVEAYDGFIYICSQDYRIEFMNQRMIERTGHNAVGERCYKALHERDSVCPWCVNEGVFRGETMRWELQSPKDQRWYQVVNTPIRHTDGTISKQSMIVDITDRKVAEEELLTEKNKLQSIMGVINRGITIRNLDYELVYQNDYSLNMFGNHLGEKCYCAFEGMVTVCNDCPAEKAFQDGKPHSNVKRIEIRPGEITFWENTAVPMRDTNGNIYACLEISNNITGRKQAEEELLKTDEALRNSQKDLKRLAGRLISAREEELRRLSRELHDDLTQRLAVIAIEAGKLEQKLHEERGPLAGSSQKIAHIKDQLIAVSQDIHHLSRQLHPSILDDLGLVRAIESECAEFMRKQDVGLTFRKEDVPDVIPVRISLCFYRIVQEGLRNIATHSRSQSCEIFLKGSDGRLCLTVTDDGIGFDFFKVRLKPGLGLASMRERVQFIGGDFSITSQPGKGTVIKVSAPLTGSDL